MGINLTPYLPNRPFLSRFNKTVNSNFLVVRKTFYRFVEEMFTFP